MPSPPRQSQLINQPTLVLGFMDPETGDLVSTAKIELLPDGGLLRITPLEAIPKGSVACMPLGQGYMAQVQSIASPAASTYSSFDH